MGLGFLKENCMILVYILLLPFSDMVTAMTFVMLYKTPQCCMIQ